jgi:ABC-2 type transport system permease protein
LFGCAATYDLNDVPYAVLDQDRSAASSDLLARFDGSGVFHRVANLSRAADLKTWINAQRALLVIQIGQDFQRRLLSGLPADVQVIADGHSNTAGTATSYVGAIVEAFNADWRAAHGQSGPPVQVTTRTWYNPNLETRWSMIPSLIGTLTMMQTMLLMAMSIAREREQGTFDQLLVTPFRPAEIMAGKALPSMLIGTAQATTILLVAQLWFRIPFAGSLVTLYTATVALWSRATGKSTAGSPAAAVFGSFS